MDKEQVLEIARQYKALVAKTMPIKRMYLYGSYSKGAQNENSDIDIAVIVDNYADNYFSDTPLLWKLRRKVNTLIEPVLLIEDMGNPLYYDIVKTGIVV